MVIDRYGTISIPKLMSLFTQDAPIFGLQKSTMLQIKAMLRFLFPYHCVVGSTQSN